MPVWTRSQCKSGQSRHFSFLEFFISSAAQERLLYPSDHFLTESIRFLRDSYSFKQIKIKTETGKDRRTVLIFFHRPDLYLEIRLYFIYLRPQIRQHPALIEEACTDPERGFRTFRRKPGLLKGILDPALPKKH